MNFVDRWVRFASQITEAPDIFHKYMAYTGISVILGKRAWTNWGTTKLFPNLYLLLLAKSGSFKSHAADMIKDAVSEVSDEIEAPQDFTAASLDQIIYKRKTGLIAPDEFSTILRQEDGHFSTVKTILTSIYNCPKKYRLRYRVKDEEGDKKAIEHPVFSVVTSTTPNTFMRDARIEDMKSGFLSRFIIVPAEDSGRRFNRPREINRNDYSTLTRVLSTAYRTDFIDQNRPITFTDEANELHRQWYGQIRERMENDFMYSQFSNSVIRMTVYAIKFAMLEAVMNWTNDETHPTIDVQDMRKGIEVANEGISSVFSCMEMLEDESVSDRSIKNLAKAEEFLSKPGNSPVTKAELYRHLRRIHKHEMERILGTLVDSGKVSIEPGANGRQDITWRGTVTGR